MRTGGAKTADSAIATGKRAARLTARVVGIVKNQAQTSALTADLAATQGKVQSQGEVAQIALAERHRAAGQAVNAFVPGFGHTGRLAIASTVAHDCHHMIVAGTRRDQMALAAEPSG